MDSVAPFTGLLLGQPTLRRRIKLGALAALDQRIALRYALPGMTAPETATTSPTTSKLAGRSDTLFSDDAARPDPPGLPRAAPRDQQPRRARPHRRLRATRPSSTTSAARAAVAEVTAE